MNTLAALIPPDIKAVLIKVPRTGSAAASADELYEATRKWWRVGPIRRDSGPKAPEFAFAVLEGRIAAVYRIDEWVGPEPEATPTRWAFTGSAAQELQYLIGADVRRYFPAGAQNPLRYVNCDDSSAREPSLSEVRRASAARVDLADTVRRLRAEPLARIMFGHKELFHSNLIAWFFEALPLAADRVFQPLVEAGPESSRDVRREWLHLDLVMRWHGSRSLVIENKVFSLPDVPQLLKYQDRLRDLGIAADLYLLSLTAPALDEEGCVVGASAWQHISFQEIGERIRSAVGDADTSYEAETMRRYSRVCFLLHDLASAARVKSPEESVELPEDVLQQLSDPQLAAALKKMRAAHVAHLIDQHLAEHRIRAGSADKGFTNGSPLVEWHVPLPGNPDGAIAGWQLQGGQFRRFMVLPHLAGSDVTHRFMRAKYAAEHEDLFDFSRLLDGDLGQVAPVVSPKNEYGFNHFAPDFVYRYVKAKDLRVEELLDMALRVARSILI